MATYWENSCSFGLRYVSWYKCLIVSLVFSHLGFWSGNLFLIAPFPDLCLLVPFSDDVGKQVYHWTTRYFWQYPDQCEDFTALSVLLESEDLTNQQRLVIAKDVTKRIHQLHDKMFFQQDLKLNDIFINKRRMVIEPRREKTGLRGFRPSPTQTGLYKLRKELEA